MTRNIINLLIFIISISIVSGATLVDSEDFESYTVGDPVSNQSSKWSCAVGYDTPYCNSTQGSNVEGSATHYIVEESGNKYLRMVAQSEYGGSIDASHIKRAYLIWDNTNSSTIGTIGAGFYTLQARMRLVNFSDQEVNFSNNAYVASGIGSNNLQDGNSNQETWLLMGGDGLPSSLCGDPDDTNCQTRIAHRARGQTNYPFTSFTYRLQPHYNITNCSLADYAWHTISLVVEVNSSLNNDIVTMYQDGVQCYNATYNPSTNWAGDDHFFSRLDVGASGAFTYDLDNIYLYENGSVTTTLYECNDNSDNDGDGFTDYPADPSCTSATDDTESPYSYVQCNNGIDDDGDGFTDYPADPSCDNSTDNTESPRDDSPAGEDTCLVEEGCLLKDTIPYNDELDLHGWYNTIGSLRPVNIYGSNKIYFDTDSDTTRFNTSKNISNPNIYNDVISEADFYLDIGDIGVLHDDTVYTFYWEHLDAEERLVNSLRFNITRISASAPDYVKVLLYNYNGTTYEQVGNTIFPSQDSASRVRFTLYFDQVLKTYDIEYAEYGEPVQTISDLTWGNVMASKINAVRLKDVNSIDDSKLEIYADDLAIYTNDISYDTVCDEFDLPYYLKESFNGYPMACDWTANLNIFFTGQYALTESTPLYFQQKEMAQIITDNNIRYVTVTWDMKLDEITTDGSNSIRLYDDGNYNFLTVYWSAPALNYYYNNNGDGVLAQSNIPANQTYAYKLIIDMQNDDFDIYFNDTQVVSGAGLSSSTYNLQDIENIKVTSSYSDLTIDNLNVFASTEDGTPFIPDDELEPVIENETTLCGIIYTTQPVCTDDSDCASGKCLVNNKCARWSADYCTENGMAYGNKCFLAGTADCALTGAKDIIIGNFLLFLIFLILVMLAVYLVIMFRRE